MICISGRTLVVPEGCLDKLLALVILQNTSISSKDVRLPIGSRGSGGWRGALEYAIELLSKEAIDVKNIILMIDADSSISTKRNHIEEYVNSRFSNNQVSVREIDEEIRSINMKIEGMKIIIRFGHGNVRNLGIIFWCGPKSRGYCTGTVEDVIIGVLKEIYGCKENECISINCSSCPSKSKFIQVYNKLIPIVGLVSCFKAGTIVGFDDEVRCGIDVQSISEKIKLNESEILSAYNRLLLRLID